MQLPTKGKRTNPFPDASQGFGLKVPTLVGKCCGDTHVKHLWNQVQGMHLTQTIIFPTAICVVYCCVGKMRKYIYILYVCAIITKYHKSFNFATSPPCLDGADWQLDPLPHLPACQSSRLVPGFDDIGNVNRPQSQLLAVLNLPLELCLR